MTVGKATALTAGFIAVFAFGVAVGPSVQNRLADRYDTRTTAPPASVAVEQAPAPEPAKARATTPRARTAARKTPAPSAPSAASAAIPASEPRLHARLRPVLNSGARMEVAADGFRSAEEFATVAHAARNTKVPFMLLKHRVVTEGRTLADAIRETKPELDAQAEVQRAEAAARSDMDAVVG